MKRAPAPVKDVPDLIGRFGIPVFAALIDVPDSHVRTMKARGSIAPIYWPPIVVGAANKQLPNVSYEFLIRLCFGEPRSPDLAKKVAAR